MKELDFVSVFHKLTFSHGITSLILNFLLMQFFVELLDLFLIVFHVPLHSGIHGLDLGLPLICHVAEENAAVLVISLHFLVVFFVSFGLFGGSYFFFLVFWVVFALVVSEVFLKELQC